MKLHLFRWLTATAMTTVACGSYTKADATDAGSGDTGVVEDSGGDSGLPCVPPAGQTCSVVNACGCAAGQNCIVLDSKFTCATAGSRQLNESCSATGDCGRGLLCAVTYAGGPGICKAPCTTVADCPTRAHEWKCIKSSGAITLCEAVCDPRDPAFCGPNGSCAFVKLGADADSICIAAGTGIGLGTCHIGHLEECAPGYLCNKPPTTAGDCLKWCQVGSADCGAGKSCTQIFPAGSRPSTGGTEYSVCPP